MIRFRALWLFALMLFAVEAAPLWANTPPPPFPPSPRPDPIPGPAPNPVPTPVPTPEPLYPKDPIVRPTPPKRTGPFRSCGSGMGVGLVGIGAAWAMLWLGSRLAGHISRKAKN